jgi:hypothetical protein
MAVKSSLFDIDAAPLRAGMVNTSVAGAVRITPTSVLSDAIAIDKPSTVGVIVGTAPAPVAVVVPPPVAVDIAKDSAFGRVRETIAVAKRLETSPSVEFRNIATQAKQRFFVDGIDILAQAGILLEDIPVRGYAIGRISQPVGSVPSGAPTGTPPGPRPTIPMEDVV